VGSPPAFLSAGLAPGSWASEPPRSGSGYGDRAGSASTCSPAGPSQPSRPKTRCRLATFPSRAPQLERALSSMAPRAYPAVGKSLRPPPSAVHRFPGRPRGRHPLPVPCAAHRFPGCARRQGIPSGVRLRRTDFPVIPGRAIPSRVPARRTDFPVAPRSSPARLPGGLPGLTYSVGDRRPVAHPRKRQKSQKKEPCFPYCRSVLRL
jgi:hypothetical protein